MTGTPAADPDETPVTMGQGEYEPDVDDARTRKIGTRLRDAQDSDAG